MQKKKPTTMDGRRSGGSDSLEALRVGALSVSIASGALALSVLPLSFAADIGVAGRVIASVVVVACVAVGVRHLVEWVKLLRTGDQ